MTEARRPTPEAMLARAAEEEARARHGRLKLWFGAAPGVGKTYAMLEAAQALRRRGVDVVIAWVQPHGRPETEALTRGLPRIPPRPIVYRGLSVEEMDLDAILARRPAVALVDELAHANAPGTRHARRWEDVLELLDAGIDVHSTLNVQHVESLNDVVAQITGVVVRETVPDSVLDRADEIELVDLSPDDLLQRMNEGKVYVPAQAQRAMESFFRKGNLIALRELVLRRTAERVDAEARRWKREEGIPEPQARRERLLVAVSPAPQSADLIRAACRMAERLQAPWIALAVETPAFDRLTAEDRERVAHHLALAERLGGEPLVVRGERIGDEILAAARDREVTRIVVGKPTHPRWRDRLRGSLLDSLVRRSGGIDVLATHGATGDLRAVPTPRPRPARAPWTGYPSGLGLVAAVTGLGVLGSSFLAPADVAMLLLLAVILTAAWFGRGPTFVAALASVACFDFFSIPPYYTFAVQNTRYLVTFAVLLLAGLAGGRVAHGMRERARAARERERRTAALYEMTREMGATDDPARIAEAAARHLGALAQAPVSVYRREARGSVVLLAGPGWGTVASGTEEGAARWVAEHGRPAGAGTDTLPAARSLFLPLLGTRGCLGTVGVEVKARPSALTPAHAQLLETLVAQTALALERAELAQESRRAAAETEAERLRSTLLSSVSHDLRTPLASITGSAGALLDPSGPTDEETRRVLLETIRAEGTRLGRLVSDLLDLTRLEAGAVRVSKDWVPLEELIACSLTRLSEALADRPLELDLPQEVLLVPADPVLLEQAIHNVLENAALHTPPGTPVSIRMRVEPDDVVLEVSDRGPGIPPEEAERVFQRFYRGTGTSSHKTSGLGLAIVRGVLRAHGGEASVVPREGGGSVFRLRIPRDGAGPVEAEPPGEGGPA